MAIICVFSDFEHINGAVTRKTLNLEVTKVARHFAHGRNLVNLASS